jgi:hypothetical protein
MFYRNALKGGCHCGNVTFELYTNKTESDLVTRACQCSFCRKHAANWIADPEGMAAVRYANRQNVSFYRFGSRTSDFIICKTCGVLTVSLCEIDGEAYAVHNIKSMEGYAFACEPAMTSFDGESVEERLARRKRNWTSKVQIKG